MSCFMCFSSEEERQARIRNNIIDRDLKQEKKSKQHEVKLLLLGAGESGKSTILKQMKVIHNDGFTHEDVVRMRPSVFIHVVSSGLAIIEAMETLHIVFEDAERCKPFVNIIRTVESQAKYSEAPTEILMAISEMWKDRGFIETHDRGNEYQLNDNTKFFFDSIPRLLDPGYLPTQEDVIRLRVQTTGIFETKFTTSNVVFNMFDVGGQRSERRKWIKCFGDVTGIIFLVAVSAYDQCLREDAKTNRLMEALTLFESIWRNQYLASVSVILFLNKIDIFEEKILRSDLSIYFPEYDGGPDYDIALRYIQSRFMEIGQPTGCKKVYPHFICAIDTDIVRRVFSSVKDVILNTNLRSYGFI